MENNGLLNILPILWKWRKEILFSVMTGTVLTAIIMVIRPNYYEGVTTFYPVGNSLLKPIVDGTERDLQYFGDEHDIDRLLTISKSSEMGEYIIRQFNLAEEYDIDTTKTKGRIRLRKKFEKLYTSTKTQYDAIRISMEDRDPERAAQMANAIRNRIDERAGQLIKRAQEDLIGTLEKGKSDKEKRIGEASEKIKNLRSEYKIYDTQYQAEALANSEMRSPNSTAVRQRIDDYTAGVTDVINLQNELDELTKLLARDADNLEKIKATYYINQPAIHVVEVARKPDEKSRPRRSLYVIAAFILLTAISTISVLLVEKTKQINWQQEME